MFVEDESSAFEIVPGSHVLAEQEDGSEYINWNDLSPEEQANYEMLHRNVLLPERQWCGLSEGDHITFGWRDRIDMHLWLDLMHNLWHEPIVVHGLSMGAATTMMLSGDEIPDSLQVVGYVEDCGYTSTWDQLVYKLKSDYGLPAFPLLYQASLVNKL